jgi:DNA invertase Pin-like site-specific DNA recombinase
MADPTDLRLMSLLRRTVLSDHNASIDRGFLHQQGLDTSTTAGKAMFQMLDVFAEFERGIIRERVNAGLARARQNGTKLGRRRVKPSVEATIRELRAKGDGILKLPGRWRRHQCCPKGRLGDLLTL